MKRAVVVGDGSVHAETALGALAAAGCEAVTVPSTAAARGSVEGGALVVVVGSPHGTLSGERFAPLLTMPSAMRRGCVIALVGDGLATGDGMQAFVRGVDLVVARGDLARLGELVAAAVAAKRGLVAQIDPAAAARLGA
jgi:hypothetical protein